MFAGTLSRTFRPFTVADIETALVVSSADMLPPQNPKLYPIFSLAYESHSP